MPLIHFFIEQVVFECPGLGLQATVVSKTLPSEADMLVSYGETLLFHGGVCCKGKIQQGRMEEWTGRRESLCLSRIWVQSRAIWPADGVKIPERSPWGGECWCAWGNTVSGVAWAGWWRGRRQGVQWWGQAVVSVVLAQLLTPFLPRCFEFSFLSGEGRWEYYLVWIMPTDSTWNTANPEGYGKWAI